MNLLRNWFLIQTSAVNDNSRGVKFEDDIMGELIRFVSAHEVGHTIGLPHNMGSSFAYHVDSLRSLTFTANHGLLLQLWIMLDLIMLLSQKME